MTIVVIVFLTFAGVNLYENKPYFMRDGGYKNSKLHYSHYIKEKKNYNIEDDVEDKANGSTHKIIVNRENKVYVDLYKAINDDVVDMRENGNEITFYVKLKKNKAEMIEKSQMGNFKIYKI